MTATTRRAFLATTAAAPIAAASTGALASGITAPVDPVFALHDTWRAAHDLFSAADARSAMVGGSQVIIPTATGGQCSAMTRADIDRIIERETMDAKWHGMRRSAGWRAEGNHDTPTLTPEQIAAARAYVRPDADALKAQLDANKARRAAAVEAEGMDALNEVEKTAWAAFIYAPATTAAGVALKLRAGWSDGEDHYVTAALADLDRTDAPQIAAQRQEVPEGQSRGQTEVERLHAAHIAAEAASNAAKGDAELERLSSISLQAEMDMIAAKPATMRDVALVVLATGGEYLANNGGPLQALLDQLEQIAGQSA